MADQSTIDVYAELYRRNAVPPEHAPIVDELVKRGVIKAGPKYGPGDRLEDGTVLDDQGLARSNILPFAIDVNEREREKEQGIERGIFSPTYVNKKTGESGWAVPRAIKDLGVPGFLYHPYRAFEKSAETGEITPGDALSIAGLGIAGTGGSRTIASPTRESSVWGAGVRRAEANAARARDFESANVPVFAPALTEPSARAAQSLMETPAGFPLRTGARDSIQAIEQGVRDVVHEAGGTRPVNEIGQEIQQDLRRNLTERSIPEENIPDLPWRDIYSISGLGPTAPGVRSSPRVPNVSANPRATNIHEETYGIDRRVGYDGPQTVIYRESKNVHTGTIERRIVDSDGQVIDITKLVESGVSVPDAIARTLGEGKNVVADGVRKTSSRDYTHVPGGARKPAVPATENTPGMQSSANLARNWVRYQNEVNQRAADMAIDEIRGTQLPRSVGGNSRETYPTEFDAGYEAMRRNLPVRQSNPLGSPNDTALTATGQLLDSVANDYRMQGLLPGYKSGRPFGDDGKLHPDVMGLVSQLAGPGVSERIAAMSEARPRGAVQFSTKGLDKIRTAVGQALADARKPLIGGQVQGEGASQRARAAFLARLYEALGQDIEKAVQDPGRAWGVGGYVHSQRELLRSSYQDFMSNVRGPLEKVFGEKTTPEQAVRILTDAARGGTDGNANLLRAYFRVADEKGDRVRATGVLLNSMLEDGLTGFLARWRDMPLEVKQMVFTGPAAPMGRRLDQLARAGGYLERFADAARPVQGVGDMARRAASGQNVLTALMAYINAPTAIAMMGGQAAASQVMASRAFQSWLLRVPTARTQAELNSVTSRMMQIAATQMGLSAKEAREMAAMVNGGRNDNK